MTNSTIQRIGNSPDNEVFIVPSTNDVISTFLYPKNWSIPTLFTMSTILLQFYLTIYKVLPLFYYISAVIFWRLSYNLILGLILHYQSNYRSLTKFYEYHTKNKNILGYIMEFMAGSGYENHNVKSAPSCLNAWFFYRHFVDIILFNDAFNFMFIALYAMDWNTCIELFNNIKLYGLFISFNDYFLLLQYIFGIFLCAFNYWAKIDAHRCIGDWAWYWEDFFYRVKQELTFDGIFEYFPHPMYTVGYSMHYGAALISRSYVVLFLALFCHLCQLLFLVLVENPHIERTYGEENIKNAMEESERIIYDHDLFPENKFTFRAFDLVVYGLGAYIFALCLLLPPFYCFIHAFVWRCAHWLVLGFVLYYQSKTQFFTKHYISTGGSPYDAFHNWKRLFDISYTCNLASFIVTAIRYYEGPEYTWPSLAHHLAGALLLVVNYYSSYSSFSAIGQFGYYYGDFFIPQESFSSQLVYTGIFRFLNNPDAFIGYAGLHGIALMCGQTEVVLLALQAQLLNIIFVYIVEIPYMQALYTDKSIRFDSPLTNKVKSQIEKLESGVKSRINILEKQAKNIQNHALKKAYQVYKQLASVGGPTLDAPDQIFCGEKLKVNFSSGTGGDSSDWIGIYVASTPSLPGKSEGRWKFIESYTTGKNSGSMVFSPDELPNQRSGGVCEIRYHKHGTYEITARKPLLIVMDENESTIYSPVLKASKQNRDIDNDKLSLKSKSPRKTRSKVI